MMRMGFKSLVAAATLLAVVSSVALADGSDGRVPALKVTAPDGATSILIGSAHVGVRGMREPDATIFNGARQFVVEHRGDHQPGDSGEIGAKRAAWAQGLTTTQIAVYAQRARCAGVSQSYARSLLMRPSVQWANQLAYSVCGWENVPSRDVVLAAEKPLGLETKYLEDDAWVEAKRRSVPARLSDRSFKWALAHDPEQIWDRIRDAINQGDYEGIRDQFDVSVGSVKNAKQLDRIMVEERNAAWMPKLHTYLDEGNAVIVVGTMHLPGESGLIQKLRNDGYKVDAISLPAKPD
ncbi:TraB/GumN family protein [Paraburkholderia sediminicola]|uniref:TraB/GumN family protein n=1 Tax=Paraburkholderia sediminicola TaxID=458836 RepID=UPI0038BA5F78